MKILRSITPVEEVVEDMVAKNLIPSSIYINGRSPEEDVAHNLFRHTNWSEMLATHPETADSVLLCEYMWAVQQCKKIDVTKAPFGLVECNERPYIYPYEMIPGCVTAEDLTRKVREEAAAYMFNSLLECENIGFIPSDSEWYTDGAGIRHLPSLQLLSEQINPAYFKNPQVSQKVAQVKQRIQEFRI